MTTIIIVSILVLGLLAYLLFHPQFGGKITADHKANYAQSEQWNGKQFVNAISTTMDFGVRDMPKMMKEQFNSKGNKTPDTPLPIVPFKREEFTSSEKLSYIWYGHSAFLLRMNGLSIAIDPMMGPDASPIGPMRTKRFSEGTLDVIDEWPELDAVLFTHDHYDHLDLASIKKLKGKVKHWYVALGVKRHLERWGIPESTITEMDWWDKQSLNGIDITFTPSRHFAGRGLTDRGKSFWGGWVLKSETESVYLTGDGGFGPHFKAVGEKLGPFDLCFAECGQYNELWHAIHMYPEESVYAAKLAQANVVVPYHWGGFKLAQHSWTEPAERFVEAAEDDNRAYGLPLIGGLYTAENTPVEKWWKHS